MQATDYLMVLPVQHYRISRFQVAVESAFAEHLRMMRGRIGDTADRRLLIASPGMGAKVYEGRNLALTVIDEKQESIYFYTLFSEDDVQSKIGKVRLFPSVMRAVYSLAKKSYCVHSGLSWDAWLPIEFASIFFGIILKRRTVFVVDIDYRNSAYMSYKVGGWSWKTYVKCRYIYDKARSLQVRIAAQYCSLVLLKGRKMASDFASGRPNVKSFLDASHSQSNIIDEDSLRKKLDAVCDRSRPLRLTYFGRLTAYKGIDRCLCAVVIAKRAGANVRMEIIGSGEELDTLRRLAIEYDAGSFVQFHGPMPFNQDFFSLLFHFHLLLAAPLREDTPRSALDAMAAGIPYLAFDTYYYQELLESGAGKTVPWPDVEAMAQAIVELDRNREQLADMIQHSVTFARNNTQEIWLERRFAWTMQPEDGL